ncbi:MAG: hypothetical protein P8H59_00455 [Flavobacteriales bacterium]|nr:hypothetical protein [Flavobacteriales bacterium]MDG2245232.1 hypothetical protein [Flavobacteriales bacterium]
MKDFLLKALPHAIAVVLFVVLSSAFFSPAYQGFELRQGDIDQFLGMSKELRDLREFYDEDALWTNTMFAGMPAYQISLQQPANIPGAIFRMVRTIFPGPVGTLFLAMLSFYILGLCMRINPWLSIIGGIAFGFASVNILYLGAGHASKVNAIALMPGVLGGVLLSFRGKLLAGAALTVFFLSMQIAAGHPQMTYYLAFLVGFVVIGEIIRQGMNGQWSKGVKVGAVLAIAAVLAVLPNLTSLMTTLEYSKHSTRGETELTIRPEGQAFQEAPREGLDKDYILKYSMSRGEFWSMLIPDVKGGAAGAIGKDRKTLANVDREFKEQVSQSNRYWGAQYYSGGAFYFGAIIIALFLLGMFIVKDSIKWPLLIVSILAIVLSWKDASWVTDFFISTAPGFAKFRDTKMMLVVIQVAAPLMALLSIQEIINGISAERKKWFYAGVGTVTLLMVIFLAAPQLILDFTSNQEVQQFAEYANNAQSAEQEDFINEYVGQLENARVSIFRADAIRSFLFVLLAFGLLFVLFLKKLKAEVVFGIIGVLVLVDLWSVDRRYMTNDKQGRQYVHWRKGLDKMYPHNASAADLGILDIEMQNNPSVPKEMEEKVLMKQETMGRKLTGEYEKVRHSVQFGVLDLNTNYRVLNINNPWSDARTSYYHKSLGGYHGAKLRRYNELVEFHVSPELQRFISSANTLGPSVMQSMSFANMLNAKYLVFDPASPPLANPYANGNAWFVADVEMVMSADDEMEEMYTFDSKYTAVVHDEFEAIVPSIIVPDSTAQIAMTSYAPDRITYNATCSSEQLAVFSEVWYPEGWVCLLDGEEVPFARANYVLRAVSVPEGNHEIEFVFQPASHATATMLSGIGSVLVLLVIGGALFVAWRSRNTEEAA